MHPNNLVHSLFKIYRGADEVGVVVEFGGADLGGELGEFPVVEVGLDAVLEDAWDFLLL